MRSILDPPASELEDEAAVRRWAEEALNEGESRLRSIFETERECVKVVAADGRLLAMNAAGLAWLEAEHIEQVQEQSLLEFIAPESREAFQQLHQRVFRGETGTLEFQVTGLRGTRRWLETTAAPLRDADGRIKALLGFTRDNTERKEAERLVECQTALLRTIAIGAPLGATLSSMLLQLEDSLPGVLCSILLLDRDGQRVRRGAAPSLPEAYNNAVDGLLIGPRAGSCGTAAFRRREVIVEDIATDPLWTEYRELALGYGLRACWSTPIFDEQKRVLGTFAIYYREACRPTALHRRYIELATDLAAIAIDRYHDETALRVSESRHRRLLESNIIGITITSTDGCVLEANDLFLRMVGYSREDLEAGRVRWDTMTPPEGRALVEHILHELEVFGVCTPVEKEYIRKDGTRVPFLGSAARLEGTPGNCICLIQDLTERKTTERELSERSFLLSESQRIAHIGTWSWELSADRIRWSDEAYRIFRVQPETFVLTPESFFDLIHPEDRVKMHERIKACRSGEKGVGLEFRIVPPDGSIRILSGSGELLPATADRPARMVGTLHDITERKEAEEARHRLSWRLMRAEDLERRRIAKELHDTTAQDLVAAIMNLDNLQESLPARDAKADEILQDTVALIENCASDLRTLSYLLHPPLLDEMGLPDALTTYAAGLARRADIRIQVETAPDFGRLHEEMELVLFRVAQESLGNVIRHSESPAAHIRLGRTPADVVLEIEDFGCGIRAEVASQPGASGVGMAGMRERLEEHGGRLEIESSSQGTTVRARLPLKEAV